MISRPVGVCLFWCLTALLLTPSSAWSQTSDWSFCAWEGGVCAFAGTQEVRYGANGSYSYQTLSNGTACTNSVFGDPAPNVGKECATRAANNWTFCAWEGELCAFAGTREVRYGANGSYSYQTLSNGTACTNSVFGDPAANVRKECATRGGSSGSPDWTVCAREGGVCAFVGAQEVRYGANGSFVYRTLSNGAACTNSVFGDPAVGVSKECATRGSSSGSPDWTFCAWEGGLCAFAGTQEVRYGANGSFLYRTLSNGSPCTNSVFGDPISNVPKRCEIRPGSGSPRRRYPTGRCSSHRATTTPLLSSMCSRSFRSAPIRPPRIQSRRRTWVSRRSSTVSARQTSARRSRTCRLVITSRP